MLALHNKLVITIKGFNILIEYEIFGEHIVSSEINLNVIRVFLQEIFYKDVESYIDILEVITRFY